MDFTCVRIFHSVRDSMKMLWVCYMHNSVHMLSYTRAHKTLWNSVLNEKFEHKCEIYCIALAHPN